MKLKNLTYFSIVASMLLLLSILNACGPKNKSRMGAGDNSNAAHGGIDSGGTLGKQSSIGQVETVLKEKKLKSQVVAITDNFLSSTDTDISYNVLEHLRESLDKWCKDNNLECDGQHSKDFINSITLDLHYDRACVDGKGHEQDASVNLETKEHKICFSVGKLARYPSESLRKQIHTIFVHEVTHLLGETEESDAIQTYLVDNYDNFLIDNHLSSDMKTLFLTQTVQLRCQIEYIESILKANPETDFQKSSILFNAFLDVNKISQNLLNLYSSLSINLKENAKKLDDDNALELTMLSQLADQFAYLKDFSKFAMNVSSSKSKKFNTSMWLPDEQELVQKDKTPVKESLAVIDDKIGDYMNTLFLKFKSYKQKNYNCTIELENHRKFESNQTI